VLIEAMACGVPVVATASSGTCEIIEHERSGLLVERHQPDDVAAALERVLSDRAFRVRMATSARARAREFSIQTVTRQFDAALAQAVNARRAA
jgi:D-inositol-3-phosphate glycosyltransferase